MRNIDSPIDRVSTPSPRRHRTRRAGVAAAWPLAGALLIFGCDGMGEEGEPVVAEASALKNTGGRSPEQQKCDEKWQACYVGCWVTYPESGDALNEDRRQGCLDSCDASHDLCAPALSTSGTTLDGVVQPGAILEPLSTTPQPPVVDAPTITAPAARMAAKWCTPDTEGGLWCCVTISTPPYLSCTRTPPPDTIWTFTAQTAARAP